MKGYVTGYILVPDKRFDTGMRKMSFSVETRSKKKAYDQLKEQYPDSRIHFAKAK